MLHMGSGNFGRGPLEGVHVEVVNIVKEGLIITCFNFPPATSMRLLQWMIHGGRLFVDIGGTLGNHCFFSSSQVIVELVFSPVDASRPPIRVS